MIASCEEEYTEELEIKNLPSEVKLLQKLDHPHVVKYHESFLHKNQVCMVLDYANAGILLIYFFC